MKTRVLFIALLFSLFGAIIAQAQDPKLDKLREKFETQVDTINGKIVYYVDMTPEQVTRMKAKKQKLIIDLELKKEFYASEQKNILKSQVSKLNETAAQGSYSEEKINQIKESIANDIAGKIDSYNQMIDAQINFAVLTGTYYDNPNMEFSLDDGINIKFKNAPNLNKYNRTESGFTVSFAYNFMSGDNLDINDFSYANNNYFAAGYQWKTILDKNKNNFRLLYGIEYQSHGTELNGNRFFTQGNETQFADIGFNADKAKFRQDQLVFPLSIEIGGSKRKDYEDGRVRFEDSNKWKVGIGGFAGFNMSSRLKLKYDLDGNDIKETRVNNFDTEKFVYGLDAYIGHGEVHLFGRINLNNVFTNNSVDAQYVTFGIRLQ